MTKTLTRVKCMSKISWENVILTLNSPLMQVKGGIKYVMDLPLHLINVKARSNISFHFDYRFNARLRRSKVPRLCIPLIPPD